ncbi:MAG: DHH family phosphoesterase [Candidatus Aenigmarchaeota archaeon]|nr:DHH family phosphoesterase [Candidatus Aenigmarchaeota archaeon]
MEKRKILVTSYKNPDLDGTACVFSYAEYLQKNGKEIVSGIFGTPYREAQFVINKFNIPPIKNAEELINNYDIVLVDCSELAGISDKINPDKVIEIIDHRKLTEARNFPNAKIQIELVGSAATLIAEKFYETQTEISEESAVFLFSAIISNTINFQAKVTTDRDSKMANWLKSKCRIPENYIHEMFSDKSKFDKPLKEIFIDDFSIFQIEGFKIGIAQLEIIEVDKFISDRLEEIKKVLLDLKQSNSLDFIFLTCIDIEKLFNKLVIVDNKTKNLIEKTLQINFKEKIARREGIIMRKEIVPKIKEFLEKSNIN